MSVHSAKKIEEISRSDDPRKAIIDAVGDLSGVDVFGSFVLVGTFIRSEKHTFKGGSLILPTDHIREDEYQGKVGLVLKASPDARFSDEADPGEMATLHTWVVFAIKDTWPVQINGTPCRFVPYDRIRARVQNPTLVF